MSDWEGGPELLLPATGWTISRGPREGYIQVRQWVVWEGPEGLGWRPTPAVMRAASRACAIALLPVGSRLVQVYRAGELPIEWWAPPK